MVIHAFKGYGHLKKTKDGKYLGTTPKKIEVYDSMSFKKVAQFGDMRNPNFITFSSDSRLMAVKNTSGLINLYNLEDMSFIKSFQPTDREGFNILFTPDNENILSSDWDGNLYLINISSGNIKTLRYYENFILYEMNYDARKNMFYMIARQRESIEDKTYQYEKYYSILIEWQYPFIESSLREKKIRHDINIAKYNHVHDRYIAIQDEDLVALNGDLEVIKAKKLKSPYHIRTTLDWSSDGKLILLLNDSSVELIDYDTFDVITPFEFEGPQSAEFIKEDDCTTFYCATYDKTYYIDLLKGGYLTRSKNEESESVDETPEVDEGTMSKQLTKESLDAIPDDELEEWIFHYVIEEKIKDDWEHEEEILRSLPKGLRYVYATGLLEDEIDNGGFNQYFYNTWSKYQGEAVEGFERMGALEYARLLTEAIAIHNEEKDMHEEVQEEGTLEAFFDSYEETELTNLDQKFYTCTEDLSGLRIDYIRNHPEEFITK